MKKFFTLVTVLIVLFFWSCSSSQEKECECPPPAQSQDDSKSQQSADSSKTAEKTETATRSGEAEQPKTEDSKSGEAEQSKPTDTAATTKPAESKPTDTAATTKPAESKPAATGSDTKSGEAAQPSTTVSSASGSYPDPKTPIAQKPLNTASSILGGSGEAASATQPAGTREGGSGESQAPSDGTSRDQIRKIDRESEYVIPPQVVPVKGSQSNNQTTPAPQGAGGSFSLKCEDYNEDTKSVVCRGNSSSLKGDAVLEFDARKFKKLFMGFDLTLRSGEIEVQIPGKDPVKATPSKPFVYLGEVQSNNDKVQVRVKADPQEAKEIDYIVRLFYHGQG